VAQAGREGRVVVVAMEKVVKVKVMVMVGRGRGRGRVEQGQVDTVP
jgi:hypothetical protein